MMDVLLIIAVLLVAGMVVLIANRRRRGILEAMNAGKSSQKEQRKEQILALFSTNKQISFSDIEPVLDVSAKTVRNYLDELEAEQKIVQHGTTGRGVYYTKKR